MSQEEFLARIARHLEEAGVPFMVAGSVVSSHHGRARATNDIDIVIDPTADQLTALLAAFGQGYYVSEQDAHEALRRRSMFNIIDFATGMKADLIVRKDRPFSVEEFARRKLETVSGCRVPVASPEDIILSKLEWDKITPSERQIQDALIVVAVQSGRLDLAYLRHWAAELGIAEKLEELLNTVASHPGCP